MPILHLRVASASVPKTRPRHPSPVSTSVLPDGACLSVRLRSDFSTVSYIPWLDMATLGLRSRFPTLPAAAAGASVQSEDDALAFVGEFRRRRDAGANNVWIVKPIGELTPKWH